MKMSAPYCVAVLAGLLLGLSPGKAVPGTQASTGPVASQPGPAASTNQPSPAVSTSQPGAIASASRPDVGLPELQYEDLVLLMETARRSFRDTVQGKPNRGAAFRPLSLRGVEAIIHLTLRSRGVALAEGESHRRDVVDAAVAAGALLGESALKRESKVRELEDQGNKLGLELEMLGPWEYLDYQYDASGTWSDAMLHSFEPAAEGIGVEFRGKAAWVRPSEVIALSYTPDLALQAIESGAGLRHVDKLRFPKEIRYFRFGAYHLWQSPEDRLPVVLVRGAKLVPPEATSATDLDAAIDRIGNHLRHRQNRSGWFADEYLPAADKYAEGNSAVAQMQALEGLAVYAAYSGREEVVRDVTKGIAQAARFVRPVMTPKAVEGEPTTQGAGATSADVVGLVLWFPGHEHQLEISARLLQAMTMLGDRLGDKSLIPPPTTSSAPSSAPTTATSQPQLTPREQMAGLVEALLAAQDEDGRVEMVFQVGKKELREDAAAAGWALMALAGSRLPPDEERIEAALQRGLNYYSRRAESWESDPVAAAALARAFALGYARTNDARASELVFEVLDQLVRLQVDERSCPWPELRGAVNAREPGAVGADTAIYVAALADGAALADRVGDKERAKRDRAGVLAGARFILQLEIREEGCYYVRNPWDALGGIRTAPWDHRLRADYCADALTALIRARQVLYGEPKRGGG